MHYRNIKIIFVLSLLSFSLNVFSKPSREDYLNTSIQFSNRGWDISASEQLRSAHLLEFGDLSLLSELRIVFSKMENNFRNIEIQNYNFQDLIIYYPELIATSNADIIKISQQYREMYDLFGMVANWTDLFGALDVSFWKDKEGCDANTSLCGRNSKATLVLQTLPGVRRQKIEILKKSLNEEISFAKKNGYQLVIDRKVFTFFQFLNDANFIGNIISERIFNASPSLTERKTVYVEGLRSILMQVFKESDGRVITSDSMLVDIEPLGFDTDDLYNYYKSLMYTEGEVASNVVTNLIFDKKIIKPFAAYYLSLKSDADKKAFELDLKKFLIEVVGLKLDNPELNEIEKQKITYFLMNAIDYLHKNSSVESLRVAKKIEYYLKDLNNE